MSQALAPARESAVTLRSLISAPAMQDRFKEVLKDKAPQFISSLLNIGNTMRDVEPKSIIQSAMIAATLDLPIDRNLGFAWIVPFKNNGVKMAQFQMGFKGFLQLALRTGQYKRMNARTLNKEAIGGFDDVGEPVVDWSKVDESKPVEGYVFAFQLVNGFTKIAYWSKARVEAHAKQYSQSFRGVYDSPWKSHFDAMALKTVVKNELSKWGILSIEMQGAMEKDQAVVTSTGEVEFLDHAGAEVKKPQFDGPTTDIETVDSGDLRPAAPAAPAEPQAQHPAPHDTSKPAEPAEPVTETKGGIPKLRELLTANKLTENQLLAYWVSGGVQTALKDGVPPRTIEQCDIPVTRIRGAITNLTGSKKAEVIAKLSAFPKDDGEVTP